MNCIIFIVCGLSPGGVQGRAGLVWFLHRLSRKEGSVHHHMPPLCSVCTIICLHYAVYVPSYASTMQCMRHHMPPLSHRTPTICLIYNLPNVLHVPSSKCGGSWVFFCATNVHISKRCVCSLPPDISLKCLLLFLSENAKHKKCRQFLGGTAIRLCQITVQVIFTVLEIVLFSDLSKTSSFG